MEIFSALLTFVQGIHNRKAGDLRRQRTHYDAIVMYMALPLAVSLFVHACVCLCVRQWRRKK